MSHSLDEMSYPPGYPPRSYVPVGMPNNILEYGQGSTSNPPRFTPELNAAAKELCGQMFKIQDRIRDTENPLFSRVDGLSHKAGEALECLSDCFRTRLTTKIKDENTKKAIEDIIPKLLKHAKMVIRNIPEPKPWSGPNLKRFDVLRYLYEKVGEAERDPDNWEDVKKTILEAKTP